jgi:hypothetical protein
MFSKGVEDEIALELVMIDGPYRLYLGMDFVYLFQGLAHWHAWVEVDVSASLMSMS